MYLRDVFTLPANLAGLPGHQRAVRLRRADGLPIGLQLIAPPLRRGDAACASAHAFEQRAGWNVAPPGSCEAAAR